MTRRALLVKIKRDLENQIRGQSTSLTRASLNHQVCMIGAMPTASLRSLLSPGTRHSN
jgi:hypothetical protein